MKRVQKKLNKFGARKHSIDLFFNKEHDVKKQKLNSRNLKEIGKLFLHMFEISNLATFEGGRAGRVFFYLKIIE